MSEVRSAVTSAARRGRLKIFFGYAAGVGKTYAMLQAAQRDYAAGRDVVVGYVEPHNRPETASLLHGLPQLPLVMIPYHGVTLREFHLDEALARHPGLILVDELAHTNAEGCRHTKRWQDVVELLDAGIDVSTTLNVQHLESLNDVIAQITGIRVQETVPDQVFEQAAEIELIDLTPEELIERLRAGKVYLSAQAERALQNFFQHSKLSALREIALRESAERVSADVQSARQSRRDEQTWPTSECLVVCVGPSPSSARVIRSARRMAAGLRARWYAVTVETAQTLHMTDAARQRLANHLQLATELGAETRVLSGTHPAEEIISFARSINATKIVIGKPVESRVRFWQDSLVDHLLQRSGQIDVFIVRGTDEVSPTGDVVWPSPPVRPAGYLAAFVATGMACGLGWLLLRWQVDEANVVMLFLAVVLFISARFGRGPGIVSSVAGVLAFDFFMVEPRLTFAIADAQYLLTFLVLLAVSMTTSHLTSQLREQVETSRLRERRTETLYQLGRQLSGAMGTDFLLQMAGRQVGQTFAGTWAILLVEEPSHLQVRWSSRPAPAIEPALLAVAEWSRRHGQACGTGTDTLPHAGALVVPLTGAQQTEGVMIGWNVGDLWNQPDSRRQLETAAGLIALALERDRLTIEARQAVLDAESERLRNALLNSLSHDLRTPLAVISGASSSLLQKPQSGFRPEDQDLLQTIYSESDRLSRLIDSLLQLTRIEAGGQANFEWNVVEEVVGSALRRVQQAYPDRHYEVQVAPDLPLMRMDAVLMELVCFNLLENAARYSPASLPIELTVCIKKRQMEIAVADHGPGIAADELTKVFQKFYRGRAAAGDPRGSGLGLAICDAIVHVHQGQIHVENRPQGGAVFRVTLPCRDDAPQINPELQTISPDA